MIIATGGNVTAGNYISNTSRYYFADAVGAVWVSTGRIVLSNNSSLNDVGLVCFGSTTSSFPALKRDSTTIKVRLADDSNDANLTCAELSATVVKAPSISGVNLVSATNVSAVNYYGVPYSKSISIINPSSTENITLFYASEDYRITKLIGVVRGSSTPSAVFTVRKDTSRAGTGTEVVTGGTSVTSTTTGTVVTSFNSNTIPASNFVWMQITGKSGTVTEFHLTIEYVRVAGIGGI